jgi:hypothetical protein
VSLIRRGWKSGILREVLGRVALGIDRDEEWLDGLACGAEMVECKPGCLQVGRADVRAVGKARIDDEELAPEIRVGARPASVVDERERPSDRLAGSTSRRP